MAKNVWTLLLEEHDDAVDLAENVVSAAIGADSDPTVFTDQLGRCGDYIFGGPDAEASTRLLALTAAFAGLARGLTSEFGSAVVEVKEEDGEVGPDDRRNAELHALRYAGTLLRDTIAGDVD